MTLLSGLGHVDDTSWRQLPGLKVFFLSQLVNVMGSPSQLLHIAEVQSADSLPEESCCRSEGFLSNWLAVLDLPWREFKTH